MSNDLHVAFNFTLEIGGVELGTFRKCSGVEHEVEVTEFKEMSKDGKMIIRKVPGASKWADIQLESRMHTSRALWEWHKQVVDGDIDGARRDGSIVVKDSKKAEIARWNFEKGWPSKWTGAEFDAGSNEIATQKITITHEGLHQA